MKMRPSGAALEDSTFCDILHKAVLQVCRDKYWADSPDWEVDGVICISVPHSQQQHVVKIHQKFPVNSVKHLDDRCYECHKRQKETVPVEEPTKESYAESVEDDASYRNVSVIDLEHATSTIMDPAQTCGQGTISSRTEQSPVRDQTQNSNFFASADLRGFSPNIHRRRSEHVKNFSDHIPAHVPAPSDSRHSNQEHSSITSHPGETTPPRKKPKITPDEFVVVKAEPDDDEDFALHMECIDEKESDILEVKDEALQPRDLAAETQDDINYLLHDTSDSSHQYNPADRSSWPQRHPTSTVTSQMDTSLTGQGAQGFSNILSTHGVDVEDGTMRLTTRVQHPSLIAGQSDSNAQDQRTMTRPSGQDSTAAANTIGDETFFAGVRIKLEPVDPEDFDMYGWPSTREDIPHHSDSIYGQTEGGSSACEDLQHHSDASRQSTANSQSGPSTHPRSIEDLHSESADQSMLSTNSLCESNACPSPSDALLSEIHQSQYRYPITKSLLTNKQVMSGHVKFNLTNPEGKPDSNTTDDKQTWKYLEQNILTKDKPAMKWPVRNYPCEYCRKVYHKTTRLKDHIKKIHSNQQQTKVDGFPKDIDKGISENSPHAKSNEKDTNMDKGLETESDMLYEKTSWSLETVIKAEGPEVSEFSTSTWGAQKRKPRRKRRTGPCQNQQKKQVSESKQRTNFQDETMLSAQKKMFGKRNRYVDHSYSNQQKILLNQSGPNGQEQQQEVPLSEILQRVGNKLSDSEMTIPMSRKDREMCNRPIVSSGMLFGDADLTLITGNHGNPVLGYGSPAMITGFPALVTGHHGNPAMIADDHGNSAMFTGNHGNPGITENPGIIAGNHGNPVQLAGDHGNPTIPTGNRGNPAPTCDEADGGNIQFWCKCGKSFTCLSLFVQHKFPCEMIKSEPKPGE